VVFWACSIGVNVVVVSQVHYLRTEGVAVLNWEKTQAISLVRSAYQPLANTALPLVILVLHAAALACVQPCPTFPHAMEGDSLMMILYSGHFLSFLICMPSMMETVHQAQSYDGAGIPSEQTAESHHSHDTRVAPMLSVPASNDGRRDPAPLFIQTQMEQQLSRVPIPVPLPVLFPPSQHAWEAQLPSKYVHPITLALHAWVDTPIKYTIHTRVFLYA
jgi:hypothetical protein